MFGRPAHPFDTFTCQWFVGGLPRGFNPGFCGFSQFELGLGKP
jgi:hypothetical protein